MPAGSIITGEPCSKILRVGLPTGSQSWDLVVMDAHENLTGQVGAAGLPDHRPCGDASAARKAGRPRSQACRVAVMDAAYDVLTKNGLGGFTIERVAAAAAVGRTTIYRWWPSRGKLAVECLLDAVQGHFRTEMTGDVAQDLKIHIRQVVEIMRGEAGRIIAGIVAEGQSDPDTLAAFEDGYIGPRRAMLEKILASGVERGQLRPDLDIGMTMDLMIGGLLYRLLTLGGLADEDLVERIVDTVMRGCGSARP